MQELNNYSGDFNPNFKLEDFSQEFLMRMFQGWTHLYTASNEFYYQSIRKRKGDCVAFECRLKAWQAVNNEAIPKFSKAVSAYLENPSKDMLITLMRAFATLYTRQGEDWYNTVKDRFDAELALECEVEAWCRVGRETVPNHLRALGIEVSDLLDALKVTQIIPDGSAGGVYNPNYDFLSGDFIKLHMHPCLALQWLEKKGDSDRIIQLCHTTEVKTYQAFIEGVLPGAKVTATKLPPRTTPNEIPCYWEMKLDRGSSAGMGYEKG
ncbi:MAG: hypothetical protein PHV74_12895 [Dehalococcoidia bacterium]|nr:hypothetical protein [Dehalococcoidia bacterium]